MNKETIIKLVMEKWKVNRIYAESLAVDLFRDDFPLNEIKTYGAAITYLDHVQSLRKAIV